MGPTLGPLFSSGASCYDDESLCSMLFTCFVYLDGYIRDCLCDLGTLLTSGNLLGVYIVVCLLCSWEERVHGHLWRV